MRVTSGRATTAPPLPLATPPLVALGQVPFRLLLSAQASEVRVDTGLEERVFSPGENPISGKLELDPLNPRLSVLVRWKNALAADEHRFAKLTVEAPGQETFTHGFDAAGDIDDFIELPFSATK